MILRKFLQFEQTNKQWKYKMIKNTFDIQNLDIYYSNENQSTLNKNSENRCQNIIYFLYLFYIAINLSIFMYKDNKSCALWLII